MGCVLGIWRWICQLCSDKNDEYAGSSDQRKKNSYRLCSDECHQFDF